jgi:hypothetical protein
LSSQAHTAIHITTSSDKDGSTWVTSLHEKNRRCKCPEALIKLTKVTTSSLKPSRCTARRIFWV